MVPPHKLFRDFHDGLNYFCYSRHDLFLCSLKCWVVSLGSLVFMTLIPKQASDWCSMHCANASTPPLSVIMKLGAESGRDWPHVFCGSPGEADHMGETRSFATWVRFPSTLNNPRVVQKVHFKLKPKGSLWNVLHEFHF